LLLAILWLLVWWLLVGLRVLRVLSGRLALLGWRVLPGWPGWLVLRRRLLLVLFRRVMRVRLRL
jgi:hypothetical protein